MPGYPPVIGLRPAPWNPTSAGNPVEERTPPSPMVPLHTVHPAHIGAVRDELKLRNHLSAISPAYGRGRRPLVRILLRNNDGDRPTDDPRFVAPSTRPSRIQDSTSFLDRTPPRKTKWEPSSRTAPISLHPRQDPDGSRIRQASWFEPRRGKRNGSRPHGRLPFRCTLGRIRTCAHGSGGRRSIP